MRRRMVAARRRSTGAGAGRGAPVERLGDGVKPRLVARIRWGNVGRLAAVLAVVALVVAWPRIATPPPRIAGDAPVALGGAKRPAGPRARAGGQQAGRQRPRAV